MTRINSNIDPKLLKRAHLVAELREITMVPASLKRSLMTRSHLMILSGIPKKFTLNTGHVKFFYNKLTFLQHRFDTLCAGNGSYPGGSTAAGSDGTLTAGGIGSGAWICGANGAAGGVGVSSSGAGGAAGLCTSGNASVSAYSGTGVRYGTLG